MTDLSQVPLPIALIVAAFALTGAILTLLGTIGLVRLDSFFDRMHAPTIGSSWGTGAVLVATIILSAATGSDNALRAVVIGIFIMVTSAATMVTLAGAALHRRDREHASGPKTQDGIETPPDQIQGQ